jgi:hypothetical protein
VPYNTAKGSTRKHRSPRRTATPKITSSATPAQDLVSLLPSTTTNPPGADIEPAVATTPSTRPHRRSLHLQQHRQGTRLASSALVTHALHSALPTTAPVAASEPLLEFAIPKGYALAVYDEATGKNLPYRQLLQGIDGEQWLGGCANEMGRLLDGIDPKDPTTSGTKTICFIPHDSVPNDKTPTYLNIVCNIRLQKEETHRVRFTAGGDRILYPGNVSTPTADMTTIKIHLNSVISTPGARYMNIDLKDF